MEKFSVEEFERLKSELKRPFVRVTRKTQLRKRNGKVYRYSYYYLQYEVEGKTKTIYLGKKIPEDVLEVLGAQRRYRQLKKTLKELLRE